MKRRDEELHVRLEAQVPTEIARGRERYRVHETVEMWIVRGRWWGCETLRYYYLLATDLGLVEVMWDTRMQAWMLVKVYD